MLFPRILLCLAASVVLVLAGCASSKSGAAYPREQARQEMVVRTGVVESIRMVALEGTKSGVGGAAGAVIGGVAGSNIGGGRGQIIASVIGAVLGGIAGHALENETTQRPAMEISVQLDSGPLIAVVQEGGPEEFKAGDRVRVLSGGGETRVTR